MCEATSVVMCPVTPRRNVTVLEACCASGVSSLETGIVPPFAVSSWVRMKTAIHHHGHHGTFLHYCFGVTGFMLCSKESAT